MDAFARRLIQVRFAIWFIVLAAAGILWWVSEPIAFDQSIEGFFPADDPDLTTYHDARRSFGSDDILFVVYDDDGLWSAAGMSRLKLLAQDFAQQTSFVER